jgi:hypothetical protein
MTMDYFVGLLVTLSFAVVFVPLGVAVHHDDVAKRDRERHPSTVAAARATEGREHAAA